MSVEYFVVCRRPLPARDGGWNLSVGPVEISELGPDDELRENILASFGGPASAVLNLSSSDLGGEGLYRLAQLLAETSGGAVLNQEDLSPAEDFARAAPRTPSAGELETALQNVVAHLAHF
jgi:hypothetical protein